MHGVDPGRQRLGQRGIAGLRSRLVVALVLILCAAGTHAQIVQGIELQSATIQIESPWPDNLLPGWFPVTVRATSLRQRPAILEFEVNEAFGSGSHTTGTIRLEPGETRTVTWLIPVHPSILRSNYQLTVEGPDNDYGYVGLQRPKSAKTLDDTYTLVSRAVAVQTLADSSEITHDQLPADWRAYTSLGRLVLMTEDGVPRAEVMEAIRDWVAVGGILQVVGSAEGLGFPTQKRFDRGRTWAAVLSEQRYGFGIVQEVIELRTDLTPNWNAVGGRGYQNKLEGAGLGVFPEALNRLITPIPGLSALPVGWLTGILVLFYLVMGPVQFTWLKRRRAPPSRLLITTPLLGLGFAALLIVASLLAQGLGVKQSVSSITWLDQQRHHVSVLAKRTVYSGSVFDSALRYGAGSAVASLSSLQHGQSYLVDLDRQILSGAYLPVRTPTDELLVRSTTARQRVAIEREGEVVYAVNGFETALEDFWYRDETGEYYRAQDGLPAGGRSALEQIAPTSEPLTLGMQNVVGSATEAIGSTPSLDFMRWPRLLHLPSELPLRCYAALMEQSPFLDDGGVPRDTVLQRHLLVGVLEAAP